MKIRTVLFTLILMLPLLATPALAESGQSGQSAESSQHMSLYTPEQDAAAIAAARAKAAAAAAEAPRIAERYGLPPLAELADAAVAAPDRIAALRAWNESHHVPLHNGFERALPAPRQVELSADLVAANPIVEHAGGLAVETGFDKLAWGATVRVTGAFRLRLHLSRVSLPPGARLWITGAGHTVGPFGSELIGPDGGLWTPSVPGEAAAVDVELPAAALAGKARYGFVVDQVLEMVDLGADSAGTSVAQDSLGCNLDARCYTSANFPAIESVRHAVAMIFFLDSGFSGQCTAQLLNSSSPGTPFLLTANHCVSTPQGAKTVEAFWDYYTATCNGPSPGLDSLPKSFGSTLLATGAAPSQSDFTLVRLNSVPAGRSFLGWNPDPNAAPNGTLLFRLSHPEGLAQDYVVTTADSTTPQCTGVPRPTFLYSDFTTGGSFGGSSGSAALLGNGEVVGQLYGSCGSDNDCSPQQTTVDGAFATTFQTVQKFLQPGNVGGVCRPDKFTLCLLSHRFRVQVNWQNQFDGSSGGGSAIASSDNTGFFYFTDPSNYELMVKILNFGTVIKVFYGELTDLHFTITVTDTSNGTVKTYQNTAGDCGGIDANAFTAAAAAVPGAKRGAGLGSGATPKRGSCAPSSTTLCLLDRRFAVNVSWMNQFDGSSGVGKPRNLSDQSGLFTFTDPTVVELVMKMVDFGDRTAFFYGTLSNLEYDITVTDTIGGTTKTYHNAAGNYCGGLDNTAFPP